MWVHILRQAVSVSQPLPLCGVVNKKAVNTADIMLLRVRDGLCPSRRPMGQESTMWDCPSTGIIRPMINRTWARLSKPENMQGVIV